MTGSRSTHGGKMMQLSTLEGLLINDIVLEEDDWGIMRAAPFTQLHKAGQYIFTRSTRCSIVVYNYQRLWMRLLYYFLEFFHCMQQVVAAHANNPNSTCVSIHTLKNQKLSTIEPLVELSQAGAHLCKPVAHILADMAHLHQSAQQAYINRTQEHHTICSDVKLALVSLQKWWLETATSHHGLSCFSKNPKYRA